MQTREAKSRERGREGGRECVVRVGEQRKKLKQDVLWGVADARRCVVDAVEAGGGRRLRVWTVISSSDLQLTRTGETEEEHGRRWAGGGGGGGGRVG